MPGALTCAVVSEIKGLLKFSQEELSTISGLPRSTLTKILAGTSIIDLEQLAKIASALNTSAGDIIQKAESRLAAEAKETSTTSPAPTLQAVPSSPVEPEEELPDFSQMAARTVSDEQYRRLMERKRFFDDLGEGVDYDPDGWAD